MWLDPMSNVNISNQVEELQRTAEQLKLNKEDAERAVAAAAKRISNLETGMQDSMTAMQRARGMYRVHRSALPGLRDVI